MHDLPQYCPDQICQIQSISQIPTGIPQAKRRSVPPALVTLGTQGVEGTGNGAVFLFCRSGGERDELTWQTKP